MPPNPNPSSSKEEEASPIRDDVEQLCTRLRDRIIENGSKAPTVSKAWRDSARLMLDRDDRELDKALNLIDWSQASSFWRSNIRSMPKFREQYDALRLQALDEWGKGKTQINPDAPEAIDPDAILGRDYWQTPDAPEGLSLEDEIVWRRQKHEEHHQQRLEEARKKLDERSRAAS